MEDNIIEIGSSVYITDPCYDTNTWCQALVKNVLKGSYIIDYDYNNEYTIISIWHTSFVEDYDKKEEISSIGVDSGCVGIFDKEYYEKYHNTDKIDENWYDKWVMKNVNKRHKGINVENRGIFGDTTWGDGEYYAKLFYKRTDKVGGIDDNTNKYIVVGIEVHC